MSLYPWAVGPFDLILHGEQHRRGGDDFDRRMALISFDNAVEVAITTYLNLNPVQRHGRTYPRVDVTRWQDNFHTKVEFFVGECGRLSVTLRVQHSMFIWYHDLRNDQYHIGRAAYPTSTDVEGVRDAAIFVFETLFDVQNVHQLLENRLTPDIVSLDVPESDPDIDEALDAVHGEVLIAGIPYSTSELLFRLDPIAYQELGLAALDETTGPDSQAIAS